jgi:hypothetical protein
MGKTGALTVESSPCHNGAKANGESSRVAMVRGWSGPSGRVYGGRSLPGEH